MAVELNFHAKGGVPEIDRWGRPASPRLAGLGIVPSGTDLPLDGLDSPGVGCELLGIFHVFPRPSGLT